MSALLYCKYKESRLSLVADTAQLCNIAGGWVGGVVGTTIH